MKKMQERLGLVLYVLMAILAVAYYPNHEVHARQSIALADSVAAEGAAP